MLSKPLRRGRRWCLHQVHSVTVVPVTAAFPDAGRPHADAMVTATPGLALGILTADCAPVLFADLEAGVVGAAHAGWRGAHGGVIENTVAAMERLGARAVNIAAAIGPAIAQPSYEVDAPFRDQFTQEEARFFAPGDHFDREAERGACLAQELRRVLGHAQRVGADRAHRAARQAAQALADALQRFQRTRLGGLMLQSCDVRYEAHCSAPAGV